MKSRYRAVLAVVSAVVLLTVGLISYVLVSKWSYGQKKLSPDGRYSAEISTVERVYFLAGQQLPWAELEVRRIDDQAVIYKRVIAVTDGFLDCGRPSRIHWSSDSSDVELSVNHSSSEKRFVAKIKMDGSVNESSSTAEE